MDRSLEGPAWPGVGRERGRKGRAEKDGVKSGKKRRERKREGEGDRIKYCKKKMLEDRDTGEGWRELERGKERRRKKGLHDGRSNYEKTRRRSFRGDTLMAKQNGFYGIQITSLHVCDCVHMCNYVCY